MFLTYCHLNSRIIDTTGWFGTDFAIASSSDLVNWNLHAVIPTNTTFTPVNTWAPEWFIDPVDHSVNIIVSLSKIAWGPFTPSIYTATDDTLTKFSDPVAMEGVPTKGLGYIDTFAFYHE
jgi:beta-xylosidase